MIRGDYTINGSSKQFRFFKTGEFYGQETTFLTVITEKDGYCEVERFHTESDGDDAYGAWVKQESLKKYSPFWNIVSEESEYLISI